MSLVATKPGMTVEEFEALPDGVGYELVDGELKNRNVSALSSWVGGRLLKLLSIHVDDNNLGWVFGADNGFQCFADSPRTVRKPDVSFVRADRLSAEELEKGWLRVIPDLVVEVISPNDYWDEVNEKVELFHRVGVPLIWVVGVKTRTIQITRQDGSFVSLRESDELAGETIVPGFRCRVAELFPPRKPADQVPSHDAPLGVESIADPTKP